MMIWFIGLAYLDYEKNFVFYQILLLIRFIASSYTFFAFCRSPLKHSFDIFSITSSGVIFSRFVLLSFFSSAESKFVKLDGSIDRSPVALIGSEFRIKYRHVIEILCLATLSSIPNLSAKLSIIFSINII